MRFARKNRINLTAGIDLVIALILFEQNSKRPDFLHPERYLR
jgi:hypothetical protein